MAKTEEDAIRSIASSFLGMISIFEVVDGSNLIGLWLPPHHFFLQNLIWREATIVWNGHQSKKLKNRFRLRLDHSVLNTVGANQMELIEWKVSLGIRSIIPSVQDITLGRSRIDKQMQISLFFCYDTKTYIGYSAGTSACIDNTDRSRFFPFLDNFRCFGFCQFGGPDFSKFWILDKFWITQIPRLRRQCFCLKYCRRRENCSDSDEWMYSDKNS